MADFGDFIDEDHDFGLKNFSGVGEVSDIAESVDSDDFFTRDDDVDELWVLDDFRDDLSSGLSESDSQKATNFDNKVLEGVGLSLLTLIFQ